MPHSFHVTCKVRGKINWKKQASSIKKKKVQGKRSVLGTVRGGGTGEVKDGLFLLGQMKAERALYKRLRLLKYQNNDSVRRQKSKDWRECWLLDRPEFWLKIFELNRIDPKDSKKGAKCRYTYLYMCLCMYVHVTDPRLWFCVFGPTFRSIRGYYTYVFWWPPEEIIT